MMQQQQGGGGGGGSQYGTSPPPPEMTPFAADPITHQQQQHQHQPQPQQLKLGDLSSSSTLVEEASPISSRPPAAVAAAHSGSFAELILQGGGGGLGDEDALGGAAGDEIERGGMGASGGGSGSGGNRWPRQETLALLKIRSDMDATFRDATLKGPLWEDVSRKMAAFGYKRSAKKCKEKFENVHKYYKRTKEGRAGRQDGKSYRFFTQLEALHTSTAASATTASISIANPMPLSSVRIPPSSATPPPLPPQVQASGQPPPPAPAISGSLFEHHPSAAATLPPVLSLRATAPTSAPLEISFSSDSASSSSGTEDDAEEEDEEIELESETTETRQRKRKRGSSSTSKQRSGSTSHRMMEFFEGLMKQVMQKQEALQQRFLEAIEKREQDRMIREEAWKRQEMARLARDHDLMAQERAISASRDAAIIAFLQKITGQSIQLPQPITIPSVPPPAAAPTPPPSQPSVSIPTQPSPSPPLPASSSQPQHPKPQQRQQTPHHQPPPVSLQPHQQHEQQILKSSEVVKQKTQASSEVVMAVPEQQVSPQELSGAGGSFEATSSRWPRAEVIALINLRSGLESRYQEAGPKGPLWEEISEGMLRMGYKRSAKRCKEKWENINKYFKKVKESNKKRPEDAKTCPYFHQLDALHKKKILGNTSSAMGSGGSSSLAGAHQTRPDQEQQQPQQHEGNVPIVMPSQQMAQTAEPETKNGGNVDLQTGNEGMTATLFGEGSQSGAGEASKKPEDIVKDRRSQQHVMINGFGNMEAPDSDNIEQDEDDNYEDDQEDDEDEEAEEDIKMAYKIQFQRHSTGSSNGGGNGAPSYFAMVQ